jgi:L-threonylcarbamoyladenylate synthase
VSRVISIQGADQLAQTVEETVAVLRSGGVVLYPTDTTYALAANALDEKAVDRVFQLKGRDYSKPIHVIVRDMEQAAQYVFAGEMARSIANHFLPGALTLVLPQRTNSGIPPLLVAGATTLGVRIPDHPVCKALSNALPFPVTTTSANRSGMPNTYSVEAVREQLGTDFDKIDLTLDVGELDSGSVSTVIAIEGGSVKLIREGAISFSVLSDFLTQHGRKV